MNTVERDEFYDELVDAVARGELTWGDAVHALRTKVARMNQETFARMTKISVRTLRNLETDAGNPTLATLESVLHPFGLKLAIERKG